MVAAAAKFTKFEITHHHIFMLLLKLIQIYFCVSLLTCLIQRNFSEHQKYCMQRGAPEWGNDSYEKKNAENILHYQRKMCATSALEVQRGTTEKKTPINLLAPLLGLWWNTQNRCCYRIVIVVDFCCTSHFARVVSFFLFINISPIICVNFKIFFFALVFRFCLRLVESETLKFYALANVSSQNSQTKEKKHKLNAGRMLIDFLLSWHASNNVLQMDRFRYHLMKTNR